MVAIIPPLIGVAAKLLGKPAWELAKKLATKYMKAGDKGKAKIITEAKDRGISKQFSEIKSGMMKKVDKPKQFPKSEAAVKLAADEAKKQAGAKRIATRKKRLESVGGYNRAREEAKAAGTSYGMKKGGSVKKYAMGGGIRKANYK